MNEYNWDEIKYPSKIDYWKKFERNNLSIVVNVLYIKEMEIYPAYISKINFNYEKQIILLMIPNEEKKILALSCGKTIICIIEKSKLKT